MIWWLPLLVSGWLAARDAPQARPRALGIVIGYLEPGAHNAITDVPGVAVGQVTLNEGDHIRTGVTVILPHAGNLYQEKVPAAVYVGNGFGKLTGSTQVRELGNLETPIALCGTLNVPRVADAIIDHALQQNPTLRSVNPVVGETNDGRLNDIRGRHVRAEHVLRAIAQASGGPVEEGAVGAGTGTICHGFKGGIGTASRKLRQPGPWTLGVLVQTNFGGGLEIKGVSVGEMLGVHWKSSTPASRDGSLMVVLATDAPLSPRNLERLAKRALYGMARTGGMGSNGSGDYVIAFSTAQSLRIRSGAHPAQGGETLSNGAMTPLFQAAAEATEEAILNSLFAAKTTSGNGRTVQALPVDKVLEILKKQRGSP